MYKILVLSFIVICVCYYFPVVTYAPIFANGKIRETKTQESLQKIETKNLLPVKLKEQAKPKRQVEWIDVKVTSYDLSVRSCGKRMSHKEYGISRSGVSIKGDTRESAMAVAVDPDFIPLGSIIQIKFFKPEYQKYNGRYHCIDTGSAVKKNRIDLFMGDFGSEKESKEVLNFGITEAKITIIKKSK